MIHLWTVETTTVMAVDTTDTNTGVTASRVYSMVEIMAGEELNDVSDSEKGVMAHIVEDIVENPGVWSVLFLLVLIVLSLAGGEFI